MHMKLKNKVIMLTMKYYDFRGFEDWIQRLGLNYLSLEDDDEEEETSGL